MRLGVPRTRMSRGKKGWNMKKSVRLLSLVLVAALCVAALAGCTAPAATTTKTAAPATVDTFTYAQGADPRGLDPALVDDGESSKVIVNIYEGLLKYAPDSTKVEPSLAESWKISADGLSYTFKLKKGVKFHDGTDFNADAVKFNIDRQLPPKVTADMGYAGFVFGTVKDVVVVDPQTVTINLSQKNTAFLANLAMSLAAPMVSPKALTDGNNSVMEKPVGTGPYKFVKWDKGQDVVLVRNDAYWGTKALTKNVVFRIIADNSARVLALNNKEVDMIDGIDATVVDKITSGGDKLYTAGRDLVDDRGVDAIDHVDFLVVEREHAGRVVGDYAEDDVLGQGLGAPVRVIADQDDVLTLVPLHELVGTGADRGFHDGVVPGGKGLGADDRSGQAHGQVRQERGVLLAHVDRHGVGVDHDDVLNRAEHEAGVAHVGRDLRRKLAVDVELDGVGVEVGAVVELDALLQLERVAEAVGADLPRLSQARLDLGRAEPG